MVSDKLREINIDSRIISIPCMQNFIDNDDFSIIPSEKVFAITYGVSDYYYRFTKNVIGLDRFGTSAKKEDILNHFGFNSEAIMTRILESIGEENE